MQADCLVTIIGSGFGGLCSAIRLQQAGMTDFVILEKDAEFGGTWRVNQYPGCACDVPSHLYSFSFAQHPDWSRKFARRDELWAYTQRVVAQFKLLPHIRTRCGLQRAEWQEAQQRWKITATNGEQWHSRAIISATGPLSQPKIPALPGLAQFAGKQFHSATWDHGYDLTGKRVAVIGTGASAIQFVPEIAPNVAQLDLYQRSAPWVLPRPDRAISRLERWLLRHVPPLQWLYRGLTYAYFEARLLAFTGAPLIGPIVKRQALGNMRKHIQDPALREKLTPDYALGCKRILLMNEYYPTLAQPHVRLCSTGIREVRAHSIIDADGVERQVDAIIFATGFDVEHSLGQIDVIGRAGASLQARAEGGLEAYKGICVPGFPNFFMIDGPNTVLGHNSVIYMIESATTYVQQAITRLAQQNWQALEVKQDVCRAYNDDVQRRLVGTVWNSGCKSWYLSASGKNHTLWPRFTFTYRRLTKKFDAAAYHSGPLI
jgi:cyclohexanone monooxygenase